MGDYSLRPTALSLRAAYKRYGSQVVLRGLDMTVPQGSIYVLLGPSGGGKSTIFKCIVGTEQLDSGEIVVNYNTKEQIGYMPQEICLYSTFTIKELAFYYGMLYGMQVTAIDRRLEELSVILQTPSAHKRLDTLSGGQKRRVSLLVSLFHNPKFLILDEPTVGLDPLVRDSIWQYFVNLSCNETKTVLITTHYIEEARKADLVGMLRGGVLLAEESPATLLRAYQSDSLEDVFLALSQSQTNNIEKEGDNKVVSSEPPPKPPIADTNTVKLYRLRAQNFKIVQNTKGNMIFSMTALLLPIVQMVFLNLTIGLAPGYLHMGYVNDEVVKGVRECHPEALRGCHTDALLSCRILDRFNRNDKLIMRGFDTLEDGISAVKTNKVWGLLHISQNYSSSLLDRFESNIYGSDEDIDSSVVSVWLDSSDVNIDHFIRKYIYSDYMLFAKSLLEECGWPDSTAVIPIRFEKNVYGSGTYKDFVGPAFVILCIFYSTMTYTSSLLIDEKVLGFLDRNKVAGLNIKELILSHAFAQMILAAIQLVAMLVIQYVVFSHPMVGSWPLLMGLLLFVAFEGMCYGIMISTISEVEFELFIYGTGTFVPLFFLSGCMWPIEGMHYLLRPLGYMAPLTQAVNAYRDIGDKHRTLAHPTVYLGFLSCLGWSAFCILTSYAWNKWLKKILR